MDDKIYLETSIADIHSHVLPRMDDGAECTAMSADMLAEMYRQGIRRVVASSHFYANEESLDSFFARRERAIRHLSRLYDKNIHPELFVGAEVAFFEMISHAEVIPKLALNGTKYIMIEMPFSKWAEHSVNELYKLQEKHGLTPIIAHIERYGAYQKKDVIRKLHEDGIKIQVNAEFFLTKRIYKKFSYMLKEDLIDFVGSDAHNMDDRKPDLGDALLVAKELCGDEFIKKLEQNSDILLKNAEPLF